MKVILEGVLYGGESKLKNGKVQLTFIDNGKIRKVRAGYVENVLSVAVGSVVNVSIDGVSSVFSNFGDLELNAVSVEVSPVEE